MQPSEFKLEKGAAFLVLSGPKYELHLHIVLTNQNSDGEHLVASVTSVKDGHHDAACEIKAGEHSSITKDSFVLYRATTRMMANNITSFIRKNYYIPKERVSDDLLSRVCNGVVTSEHIPRGMRKFYETHCKIPAPLPEPAASGTEVSN
jgi:hypothetical protein